MKLNTSDIATRLPWVEPSVSQLDVRDTQAMCHTGGDLEYTQGGNKFPDCTRS